MKTTKTKILLVEDHILVREGIRNLLQTQDDMMVMGEASDGRAAVQMAAELQPDVVLMDIAMPHMDGIEATRAMKKTNPAINVIVLTAYDNDEFVLALMKAGVSGYLLKHVRGKELLNAIRAVSHGESVLDATVTQKVIRQLQPVHNTAESRRGSSLSKREMEVLKLGATGLINKEVAAELSLGERTIQTHWRNIFNKLGVNSRVEAIMHSMKKGWVEMEPQDGSD